MPNYYGYCNFCNKDAIDILYIGNSQEDQDKGAENEIRYCKEHKGLAVEKLQEASQ